MRRPPALLGVSSGVREPQPYLYADGRLASSAAPHAVAMSSVHMGIVEGNAFFGPLSNSGSVFDNFSRLWSTAQTLQVTCSESGAATPYLGRRSLCLVPDTGPARSDAAAVGNVTFQSGPADTHERQTCNQWQLLFLKYGLPCFLKLHMTVL